jgi:hypothetical protein
MRLTPAEEKHPGMIHEDRTRPHLAMQFPIILFTEPEWLRSRLGLDGGG